MASQVYVHSQAFGELKATKEDLASNLTSAQYLHTLDYFLWRALAPIVESCPNLFLNFVAKCVAHQTLSPNSKYTSGDRDQLPINLFVLLCDKEPSLDNSKDMYLNRGLTIGLVSMFLNMTDGYRKIIEGRTTLPKRRRKQQLVYIEHRLGATTNLYEPVQRAAHWLNKATSWKNIIIQKYTRFTLMMAQRTYVDYNHVVPLDDVAQVYLAITSKAIDRCDPRMGVLTTFIQQWMKSARARVAIMAGQSKDESLEGLHELLGDTGELGFTEVDNTAELMQVLSFVAMHADEQGLVRTTLGIPQYVTAKQRNRLVHFMKA